MLLNVIAIVGRTIAKFFSLITTKKKECTSNVIELRENGAERMSMNATDLACGRFKAVHNIAVLHILNRSLLFFRLSPFLSQDCIVNKLKAYEKLDTAIKFTFE